MKKVQAAIIAAGRGERLRNHANDRPKPLVMLGGEPMLLRQAGAMMRAGADEVIAVINSETAAIMEREKTSVPRQVSIIVRDTESSMESLFALGEVLAPGHFFAATVDALVPDAELARFLDHSRAACEGAGAGFDGMLGVVKWRGDKRPLYAAVSADGAITALGDGSSPLVTAGVYFLPSRIFAFAEEARGRRLDALRRFLAMLLEKKLRLGAFELAGVIDIDEAADLAAARAAVEEE